MSIIRVLIANDERATTNLIQLMLDRTPDIKCVGRAFDGQEAVRMTQAFRPDVVLMDMMMPVMSGLDATKEIVATVPNTKIVVNTARSDYRQRALDAGAAMVLTLPITHDDIIAAIREVMHPAEDSQATTE